MAAAATKKRKQDEHKCRVDWIWGPTFIGKTLYVKQKYPDARFDWEDWSEVHGGGVFVIDDFNEMPENGMHPNDWLTRPVDRIIVLSNKAAHEVLGPELWRDSKEFVTNANFYEAQSRESNELLLFPVEWTGEEFEELRDKPLMRHVEYPEKTDSEIEDI
jgi:hypothetical protein